MKLLRRFKIATLLVCLLATICACSKQKDTASELQSLRQRIDIMEQLLIQQSAKQSAEKQVMIDALESSTQRLDALVQAMSDVDTPVSKPPATTPTNTKTPTPPVVAKTDPKVVESGAPAPVQAPGSSADELDVPKMVVIFLAVALLLLVILVVFFPGKLGSTVPTIEFSADAGAQADTSPRVDSGSVAPEIATSQGPDIVPVARRFPDPVVADGAPVAHQLSLGIKDQDSLEHWVSVLDSYLNTEPYILRNPAPLVSVEDDKLLLQFYALPNLSKTEHALLDATVQRLQPSESPETASDAVWKQGWDPAAGAGSELP